MVPKATDADARAHGIAAGYSLKNWDPTQKPTLLLGSVFDANSLGRWIYDCTVFHHGPAMPISDVAGDLWLLLIKLKGKVKRSEGCRSRIRRMEDRTVADSFVNAGEKLMALRRDSVQRRMRNRTETYLHDKYLRMSFIKYG